MEEENSTPGSEDDIDYGLMPETYLIHVVGKSKRHNRRFLKFLKNVSGFEIVANCKRAKDSYGAHEKTIKNKDKVQREFYVQDIDGTALRIPCIFESKVFGTDDVYRGECAGLIFVVDFLTLDMKEFWDTLLRLQSLFHSNRQPCEGLFLVCFMNWKNFFAMQVPESYGSAYMSYSDLRRWLMRKLEAFGKIYQPQLVEIMSLIIILCPMGVDEVEIKENALENIHMKVEEIIFNQSAFYDHFLDELYERKVADLTGISSFYESRGRILYWPVTTADLDLHYPELIFLHPAYAHIAEIHPEKNFKFQRRRRPHKMPRMNIFGTAVEDYDYMAYTAPESVRVTYICQYKQENIKRTLPTNLSEFYTGQSLIQSLQGLRINTGSNNDEPAEDGSDVPKESALSQALAQIEKKTTEGDLDKKRQGSCTKKPNRNHRAR